MADTLKELRDKLEGLKVGTESYKTTLAQIRAKEAATAVATKTATTKAESEKAKKAAQKALAQRKKDFVTLSELENYITKRTDLGAEIPPLVQKQYNELRAKYPTVKAPKAEVIPPAKTVEKKPAPVEVEKKTVPSKTPPVEEDAVALAKKEAARTKALAAKSAGQIASSDYAQRNLGVTGVKTETGVKTATGTEDINAIYELAKSKYTNVDSIFLYDPELKQLLIDAVGDPATATDDMESTEFLRRLGASDWAIRNAGTYRVRDAERREYTETLDKYNQQLQLADTQEKKDVILGKIGQLKTTSGYARGLASAKAYIEQVASGLTGTMSPERLDAFVKRMYDSANDRDPNIITRELSALISYKPGTQLGGAIGGDLTTLRATAKANGFDLDTQFGSSINDWLQRLAKGESIETFKNTIRGAAKLGLPDKVANLLDQGLDLKDIYGPYRNVMASVLEVTPDSIDLNDKTLRMAIGPEKEMSIYDFQRSLRKDPRWQRTDNAREETAGAITNVLRDFGFKG